MFFAISFSSILFGSIAPVDADNVLDSFVGSSPAGQDVDYTPLGRDEEYLRPYLDELVSFRDNPIAKKYIMLLNLVDWLPSWFEDWFVPLVFPGSKLTIPLDKTLPLPQMPGLPENITIDTLTITDLNKWKTLQPLKLRDGTQFTWDGHLKLAKTTIVLESHMYVNGSLVRATLQLPLQMLSLDFSAVMAFQRERLCEVWREVMMSSAHCALWPVAIHQDTSTSSFNMTDLRISVANFEVLLTLHDIVGPIDALALKEALRAAIDVVKPAVILALPRLISSNLRAVVNELALDGIPDMHKNSPCNTNELRPTVNISQVCFNNNAAFALKWNYHNCPMHFVSRQTSGYPADQTQCHDVKEFMPGVVEGQIIRVGTEAVAGFHEFVDPAFRYVPHSNAAGFECDGSTLLYHCDFVSVAPLDRSPPEVQKVCVTNQGGYAMKFTAQSGMTSVSSPGTYPENKRQCVDLSHAWAVREGSEFRVNVDIIGGKKPTMSRPVRFAKNNLTATWVCKGSTLNPDCNLLAEEHWNSAESAVLV